MFNGIANIASTVGNILGKFLPMSDEEKAKLDLELKTFQNNLEIELTKREQEITKRWQSDNKANVLTRNFRPLNAYLITISLIVLLFLDSFGLTELKEHWLNFLLPVAMTIYGAYYGGRTWEKISLIKENKTISLKGDSKNG